MGTETISQDAHPSKKSLAYVSKSLLAGGIAGSVAKTVTAPFDRIKILFQASNPKYRHFAGTFTGVFKAGSTIIRDNGFKALFQGHTITLARIFPYAALKFMAYEQYKALLMPRQDCETGLRRLVAGSLAGVTSVFATYPLDVIRVRMAYEVDRKPSISSAVLDIYREGTNSIPLHGLRNYYRGFLPTVYGMIPYAGVSFWTFETLHSFFLRSKWPVFYSANASKDRLAVAESRNVNFLKPWVTLMIGGAAGALAQTIAYPFDIIRRRMQVSGTLTGKSGAASAGSPRDLYNYSSTWRTFQTIYSQSGYKGFFVGLSIGYLKVTPMVATSFFVYDYAKRKLGI